MKGVGGLRVVDASIMPNLPRCNTNLTTLMIAEKMSDKILVVVTEAPMVETIKDDEVGLYADFDNRARRAALKAERRSRADHPGHRFRPL